MDSRAKLITRANRDKAAKKQRRTWRIILSYGKRNLGIPAIKRIKV